MINRNSFLLGFVALALTAFVSPQLKAGTAPKITAQPATSTVYVGDTAKITVSVTGDGPLSYQWYKNFVPMSGGTATALVVQNAQLTDTAYYGVTVSNEFGSASSLYFKLGIVPRLAPQVTNQPVGGTVTSGDAVTFSVVATGAGPISYQWYRDGKIWNGATKDRLSIATTKPSDSGLYYVVVTNGGGATTSLKANLLVNTAESGVGSAPKIVAQPVATRFSVGSVATLSVSVMGTAPFTYQWYKNFVPLSGQTSATLSLKAQLTDTAFYTVKISNAYGSSTSNIATLTIIP
jgi:hypothetical protein